MRGHNTRWSRVRQKALSILGHHFQLVNRMLVRCRVWSGPCTCRLSIKLISQKYTGHTWLIRRSTMTEMTQRNGKRADV